MKQPQQHFGDAVENQRRIHDAAHERARVRNEDSFNQEKMEQAEKQKAVVTHDEAQQFLGHTEAERAGAVEPCGPLNWNGGEYRVTPAFVPSERFVGLTSAPDGSAGALSGVDAIVDWHERR